MIFPFVELPQSPGCWPRPVLDVVGNMGEILLPCLVDSGAMNTLLPGWVAELAQDRLRGRTSEDFRCLRCRYQGADGADAADRRRPQLGGQGGLLRPVAARLGLLGQLSFFRYFVVTFRAADFELEIEPVQR